MLALGAAARFRTDIQQAVLETVDTLPAGRRLDRHVRIRERQVQAAQTTVRPDADRQRIRPHPAARRAANRHDPAQHAAADIRRHSSGHVHLLHRRCGDQLLHQRRIGYQEGHDPLDDMSRSRPDIQQELLARAHRRRRTGLDDIHYRLEQPRIQALQEGLFAARGLPEQPRQVPQRLARRVPRGR